MRSDPPRRIVLPGAPLVEAPTALRPWRDDDLDALVALCQDPEIVRWIRVSPRYSPADARAYLMGRYESTHAGLSAPYAITDAASGALIGSISLMRFAWRHRRGEVGYWLGADARGHGHATRAVRLISRWGFDALGLQRIDLLAATGNPASQRVARRAGFTEEAVLRSFMHGPEERQDFICFGLLAEEADV